MDMFLGSLRVLELLSAQRVLMGLWALMGGVLFVKVSEGSDLLRKLLALWFTEFTHGQFRMQVFMTLLGDGSPGTGRVVARRVHLGSGPGSRLDREGIG